MQSKRRVGLTHVTPFFYVNNIHFKGLLSIKVINVRLRLLGTQGKRRVGLTRVTPFFYVNDIHFNGLLSINPSPPLSSNNNGVYPAQHRENCNKKNLSNGNAQSHNNTQ